MEDVESSNNNLDNFSYIICTLSSKQFLHIEEKENIK